MTAFTVTARFPAGQFNAHGSDGEAEWPPAPARLVAAQEYNTSKLQSPNYIKYAVFV